MDNVDLIFANKLESIIIENNVMQYAKRDFDSIYIHFNRTYYMRLELTMSMDPSDNYGEVVYGVHIGKKRWLRSNIERLIPKNEYPLIYEKAGVFLNVYLENAENGRKQTHDKEIKEIMKGF